MGDWSRESWELEVTPLELALKEPFRYAGGSFDSVTNVFVTLRFASVAGVGEACPDEASGETVDSVIKELEDVDPRDLLNPFNLEGVFDILPAGAARSALDIALHDLAGKIAGLSITKLLGLKNSTLAPTSVTLSIKDVEETVAKARSLADHPILKMKVGYDGDIDAVARVRQVFDGKLRLDANEGWSEDDAIERLNELERFDIELCEQPILAGRPDALREVARSTSIPIYADEDVWSPYDIVSLAGVVRGVNLKLRKSGGIRATQRAIGVARALGLEVMLGTDLYTGIGATAEAHLGPLVDKLDIDGPLALSEDPFPGVTYDKGVLTVPDVPGLGVRNAPT